jgi:hypothetical protein
VCHKRIDSARHGFAWPSFDLVLFPAMVSLEKMGCDFAGKTYLWPTFFCCQKRDRQIFKFELQLRTESATAQKKPNQMGFGECFWPLSWVLRLARVETRNHAWKCFLL